MSREEMIISALVDLISAKELAAAVMAKNHKETIKNLEAKVLEMETVLDVHNETNDKISLVKKEMTFTEEELLRLLKVQSNLVSTDFKGLFGKERGSYLFGVFASTGWNLISFMFKEINEEDRNKILKMINKYLNK